MEEQRWPQSRLSVLTFVAVLGAMCVAVSAQNQNVCSDLEALIGHVNPDILTNCARDAGCTQVTCETTGTTANFFTSIEIGLAPCLTPPEVIIQLYREGSVVELGRNPTQITNVHQIFGVTVLDFFLDFSAATAVQVAIEINVTTTELLNDVFSTYLINSTSLTLDMCECGFICCAENITSNASGTTYVWPETQVGEAATFNCPLSPGFTVERVCGNNGNWQSFDELGCGVVNAQLSRLGSVFLNLTLETYEEALSELLDIVKLAENNEVEQNTVVLRQVADYLMEFSIFVKNTDEIIDPSVISDLLEIVDSVSGWLPENVQASSSSDIVQSFEGVISVYAQQIPLNEMKNFTTNLLSLVAELTDIDNLRQGGRSFSMGENKAFLDVDNYTTMSDLPSGLDAAINLPTSLFDHEPFQNEDSLSIIFVHYDRPTLFPVTVNISKDTNDNSTRHPQVVSTVLAATVGLDVSLQDLHERDANVTVLFQLKVPQGMFSDPDSTKCVFWDFALKNWSPKGCTTRIGEDGKVVACSCSHLTNFAILVDICLRQDECTATPTALTYISYIGMSISIVFLTITIFTLLCSKRLRQKETSIYHIQLSLSMLFMLIVSFVLILFSAEHLPPPLYEGCMMVSVLVHYFTLVAVMWMGAEALLMFQKLVIIFFQLTKRFIAILSIICWVLPIFVAVIPLILDLLNGTEIDNDIAIYRANVSNDSTRRESDFSYCFISHMEVLWGTFLAPIFAVMLFNLVVFICIIVVLIRHKMGRVKRKQEQMTARTVLRLMFSIGCVMFLFGLTWLFAILIFSSSFPVLRLIFLILFTVFNSLQGFFIFVFVLNAEILNCCRKVTSQRESKSSQSRSRATTRKQSESDNRKRLNTFSTTIQSSDKLKPNRKTKRSQQKRNEKTHDESVQMTYID